MVVACQTATAAPNGYTQIPIAKVFGNGVADFALSASWLDGSSTVYTSQYGLGNWFEVGFDYQAAPASQQEFQGNAKALLVHQPGRLPDIACGIQALAAHERGEPYLVATTQPAALGISLGFIHPGDTQRGVLMGGVAYNASPKIQVVADIIGGRANYATLGVITALSQTISMNLAYAQPNHAGGSRGVLFNIAYTFHVLRSRRSSGGTPGTTPSKNPANGAPGS